MRGKGRFGRPVIQIISVDVAADRVQPIQLTTHTAGGL